MKDWFHGKEVLFVYYEFKEPYYALIKAEGYRVHSKNPSKCKYVEIYEEHITKLDGLTDTMKFRAAKGKQIYEDEALHKFAKSLVFDFAEAKNMFKEIPINSLVLVDHAII